MKLIRIFLLALLLTISIQAREKVNINFSNLQMNDFIRLVSKITHKNILLNYKIPGTINFISSTPLYDDELLELLISVLDSKGYTLIQKESMYVIVRATDAAKHNAKVVAPYAKLHGNVIVTQSIKIKNKNVDVVAAKIRHLLSKTAKLVTLKESNMLLVTDYPKNIKTIKKVIANLDTNVKFIVKMIEIYHTDAKKLQAKLIAIAQSLFKANIASQKVKIIYDENTNGIVIVGIQKNVQKLAALAKDLDVESHVSNKVEVFELKNSDAKAVLSTLNAVISKQTFTDPSLKPNIAMSTEINAIIIIGDPAIIKGLKLILDELDKEKYQVYVQAKIIEINKNKASDIGIKYGFAAGDVSSSGLYAMSANFGSKDLTKSVSQPVLKYLGDIGSNVGSAFALGATLDFLQTHGASKSISNPSILCVNNKASSIYVGKTISISTGTVTTASGLNGVTSSFKREDVGLTLKIKPRVSSVDKVTLDVETILENILDDGSQNATGQPVTSAQKVKTQAILRSGESIIIGGLVKSYERSSKNKVPLLGDIPLIGDALFSSTSETNEQDNLVVILTPYVINKSAKLSKLQKALGVLTQIQAEYNKKAFEMLQNKVTKKKKPEEKEDEYEYEYE